MRALVLLAFVLLLAPVAHAGTASISGTTLVYSGDGARDDINIRRLLAADSDKIEVVRISGAPLSAGSGCSVVADVATCTGANSLTRVIADTGAGNDSVGFSDLGYTGEARLGPGDDAAFVIDQDRPLNVDLHGDDGADNLIGGSGNDALDGGPDSDFIQGRDGADDIFGGPGIDFLDYHGEPTRTGSVRVTLDDVRDDGNASAAELDNVHSDVEDVSGTEGDDVLVGSSSSNLLYGFGGSDQLAGGAGFDILFGAAGNDTLNARDGQADRADCAQDSDTAIVDDIDVTSGCESIDSSGDLVPDRDGDGVSRPADCDDANAGRRPGLVDVPGNGVDENCDGADAAVPTPKVKVGVSFLVARSRAGSLFKRLTLHVIEAGDKVAITCPTRRCKVKRRTVTARREGDLALARYVKATLPAKTVVQIVVTRAGFRPITIRLTMGRPGKDPKVRKS